MADKKNERSWRAAGIIIFCFGVFERAVSILSGSLWGDAKGAADTVLWALGKIPMIGHPAIQTVLMIVGIAILSHGPFMRFWNFVAIKILKPKVMLADVNPKGILRDEMLRRQMARNGMVHGVDPRSVPAAMQCPQCVGTGTKPGMNAGACDFCDGTGELPGELLQYPPCKICSGTGQKNGMMRQKCDTCGGYGRRIPFPPAPT